MEKRTIKVKAEDATPQNFKEFGQVIGPTPDGARFGPDDAQLSLHPGTPRFYIMTLPARPLIFRNITYHARVTQSLGSIGGKEWFLGVANSSIIMNNTSSDEKSDALGQCAPNSQNIENSRQQQMTTISHAGHLYIPPAVEEIKVFRITGPQFVKLNAGTWHAGPLFKDASMDFYNLELSDTNEVDRTTHRFKDITFEVCE